MKCFVPMAMLGLALLGPVDVFGDSGAPRDRWQLAVKSSSIEFTGNQAESNQLGRGTYSGLEAYWNRPLDKPFPRLYLGGEIGGVTIENNSLVNQGGFVSEADFEFLSLELNVKCLFPLVPWLDAEIGTGPALVMAGNVPRWAAASGYTEAYMGGQVFTGIQVVGEHWYAGGNAKYQWVEDGFSNVRVGGHLGYRFY